MAGVDGQRPLCVMLSSFQELLMTKILLFFQKLLSAIIKLTLWVIMAVMAAAMLAIALVLLLMGVLWALIRGQKPVPPVFVDRFQSFATRRVWPGGAGDASTSQREDVVDVEVREVDASTGIEDQRDPRQPK
jgi:hypothetical protein